MSNILLVYSTTDGHTRKIASHLQRIVEANNHQITLCSILDISDMDIEKFDKIIIGASIRYGKHSREVYEFINRNQHALDKVPNAFFSVNVVARKPEKRTPETNPYLRKFLKQISWVPKEVAVFAGKIDYPKYKFTDRQIIRFIMWMTKGPTGARDVVEFTDWHQVDNFGQRICDM